MKQALKIVAPLCFVLVGVLMVELRVREFSYPFRMAATLPFILLGTYLTDLAYTPKKGPS